MEDQPEESTFIKCLLKPKDEILEDVEITIKNECYDEKELIVPKEELSHTNTSLCLDADDLKDQKCNNELLMPIKKEPCEEITQFQQKQELSQHTEGTPTNYVCKESATIEIKVESIPETSISDCVEPLDAPSLKKRTQSQRDRTGKKKKLHHCNVCEKNCKYKSTLILHMRSHTGEKCFTCNQCQANFSHKHNLTDHMRTHTGVKPFSCDLCEKKFTRKHHLTFHMRTHTGEKPFSCDLCHRNFNRKHHLTFHLRTHTGEKPFSCDICAGNFTRKQHLIFHMRTHTGEKPYSCIVCEYKSRDKRHLTAHMKTHSR